MGKKKFIVFSSTSKINCHASHPCQLTAKARCGFNLLLEQSWLNGRCGDEASRVRVSEGAILRAAFLCQGGPTVPLLRAGFRWPTSVKQLHLLRVRVELTDSVRVKQVLSER